MSTYQYRRKYFVQKRNISEISREKLCTMRIECPQYEYHENSYNVLLCIAQKSVKHGVKASLRIYKYFAERNY